MIRLKPIFLRDYIGHQEEIRYFDSTPCQLIATPAFNLNSLKTDFCTKLGIQQMKSVNALLFLKGDKILLLEFKQSDPDSHPKLRINYFIQVFKNELPSKIEGSKELLKLICQKNNFVPTNTLINSIFLVNLNNENYQSYSLLTASKRGISFVGNNESFVLNCDSFNKYLKIG
jgi:hypothetical protein